MSVEFGNVSEVNGGVLSGVKGGVLSEVNGGVLSELISPCEFNRWKSELIVGCVGVFQVVF